MTELLSSKVIVGEEEPNIKSFPTLPTAVLGIQGIAERGPIAERTLVSSYEEYERIFGSFVAGRELALAVRAFFLNGGRECWVSRTCHFTDYRDKGTATATKGHAMLQTGTTSPAPAYVEGTISGSWPLNPNDTMVGSVGGGGDQTATFQAAAAALENATGETYDLTDGWDLQVKIDGQATAQVVTFHTADFVDISAATAEEVAAKINSSLLGASAITSSSGAKVTIRSDKKGLGSHVKVDGGTANGALGFSTTVADGTGNVQDISSVTFAEVKARIEAAWTNNSGVVVTQTSGLKLHIATVATGGTASLQVRVGGTANSELGFADYSLHNGSSGVAVDTLLAEGKTPGAYVNNVKVKIADASNGDAAAFNLQVLIGTVVKESFPNLVMDPAQSRYCETVLNNVDSGSILLAFTDQLAVGSYAQRRPGNTTGASMTTLGDNGLTNLGVWDFIGDVGAGTGFYAFDTSDEISIFACPDWTGTSFHAAMIEYCRANKQGMVFAILDPPAGYSALQIKTYKETLEGELGLEYAALYWPRVLILNPSQAVYGVDPNITVCPSGYIAGVMARNDATATEGPFYQPAGVEAGKPTGLVGLENAEVLLEPKRDLIFPKRVNPITALKGYGIFIDGARTLKGDGNFPSVGERRGVSHIERLMNTGLQWVRHRNNTPTLRADVEKQVFAELYGWMLKGSFASNDPATAFFVDCGPGLNPPSLVRAGQLKLRIGLATNTPAEFVIIMVTKDTRALEEELASV
jgi:hypothetical protein